MIELKKNGLDPRGYGFAKGPLPLNILKKNFHLILASLK